MVSTQISIFFNLPAANAGADEDLYLSYWGYAGSVATILVAIIGPLCGTQWRSDDRPAKVAPSAAGLAGKRSRTKWSGISFCW